MTLSHQKQPGTRPKLHRDIGHTLWTLISSGSNALLGVGGGLLMITCLSVQEYGRISSVLAVVLIVQELVGQGINDSMVRLGTQAVAKDTHRINHIFRAGLVIKLGICGILAVCLLALPDGVYGILGLDRIQEALPQMIAAITGYGLWTLIQAKKQAALDFKTLALIRPVYNTARLCFFALLITMGTFTWMRALWIISGCFFLSAWLIGYRDWLILLRLPLDAESIIAPIGAVWRYAKWSILAGVTYVFYSRMDVLMLTRMKTESDVAVYNAAWQILTILDLCIISIMTTMMPKACHHRYYEDLLNWCKRCLFISVGVSVLSLPIFIFVDDYIPLLFPGAYLISASLLKIMYPAYILSLLVFPLIGLLYALERFYISAIVHSLLLIVSFPVYYMAINTAGTTGAAWGTLILKSATAAILGLAVWWSLSGAPRKASPLRR